MSIARRTCFQTNQHASKQCGTMMGIRTNCSDCH